MNEYDFYINVTIIKNQDFNDTIIAFFKKIFVMNITLIEILENII